VTWYVFSAGGAIATDASETYGLSAAVGLGELCEAVSIGGELVTGSAARISAGAALGKLCETVSTGGELRDSAIGVWVGELPDLCRAISIGGVLFVADSTVAGVGETATDDEVFG
jgi:hypothetical protein